MRRVRVIRAMRPFVSNAAGATGLLAASLYLLGREVFVAQIFRNMPSAGDYMALLRFFESAFLNTTLLVQLLTIFIALGGLWLARECIRLLAPVGRYT